MTVVKLRHKESDGLTFGPNGELQFGIKGGFLPGELEVDTDHPLYARLWELEGGFLEEVGKGPAKVYVDPLGSDTEFPSRQALLAHVRAEAKAGNSLAIAWLEANGTKADREAPPAPEPKAEAPARPRRRSTRRRTARPAAAAPKAASDTGKGSDAAPGPSEG